jgi:hypothetical protein
MMEEHSMTTVETPRRLIYGPALFAGYEGVVLDAETAQRWGDGSLATTWGEFARTMYDMSWDEYVAEVALDDELSADSAFEFSEWMTDTSEMSPQEVASNHAASQVRDLIAERPDELSGIGIGGASPGGNIDVFSGPLDQLAVFAALVKPVRDGFVLERDDAAVEFGMLRHLYEES